MRAVPVVVLEAVGQYFHSMGLVVDQDPVEKFTAQGLPTPLSQSA
jgi:hypothetical protein